MARTRKSKPTINTFDNAVKWLKEQSAYKPQTVKTYEHHLSRVMEICGGGRLSEVLGDPAKVIKALKEQDLSVTTIRSFLSVIRVIVRDDKVLSVDKEKAQVYADELKDYINKRDEINDRSEPKGNLVKYPDLTWDMVVKARADYIKRTHKNAAKLFNLMVVSMYTQLPPRRGEYRTMKICSKLPKGRAYDPYANYIVINRQYVRLVLGDFKTRTRLGEDKMGVFSWDIKGDLMKEVKRYVNRLGLKDGDYFFYVGNTPSVEYQQESFSEVVTKASKIVTGYDLGINDYRHLFSTWIWKNLEKYSMGELKDIVRRVGDMNVMTFLAYRNKRPDTNEGPQTIEQIEARLRGEGKAPEEAPEEAHDEGPDEAPEEGPDKGPGDTGHSPEEQSTAEKSREEKVGEILDGLYAAARPFLVQLLTLK